MVTFLPVNLSDPNENSIFGKPLKELGKAALTKAIKAAITRAMKDAWKMERQLVERTGEGTVEWSAGQIKELLTKGKVKGGVGHHRNTVNGNLELAADHANVEFLTEAAHKAKHAEHGGTRVPISGQSLVDRTAGGTLPDLATKGAKQWPSRTLAFVGNGLGSIGDIFDAFDPLEMTAKNSGYSDSWEMFRSYSDKQFRYERNCRLTGWRSCT